MLPAIEECDEQIAMGLTNLPASGRRLLHPAREPKEVLDRPQGRAWEL